MKQIIDNIKIQPYHTKSYDMYFGNKTFAIFDIETTGLSPEYCKLILSGILLVDGENCRAIQYFAESLEDEAAVIEKTLAVLNSVDYVVTFNGKHFDIPFLKKRAIKNNINYNFTGYNLDLYLIINGHSDLKSILPNLKQKTVEAYMGLSGSRDDEISGDDSVDLYYKYLQSKSEEVCQKILLHNHDDIIQLYKLLPVLSQCDMHKAMYKLGFPVRNANITKIHISGHDLHVKASQKKNPVDYISFPSEDKPFHLTMSKADNSLELTLPGQSEAGAIFFDAENILNDISTLERFPAFESGYLIGSQNGVVNYVEINSFLISFFDEL